MNNSANKIPTYGALVSSMEYEKKLQRREWVKKNKARLMFGCMLATAIVAIAVVWVIR